MVKRNVSIFVIALTVALLAPCAAFAAVYSVSDMVGTWESNAIASGPSAPWWMRGPMVFNSDGSWSATYEEYPSTPYTLSSTYTISPEGTIQIDSPGLPAGMSCNMDLNKTVMACTATWGNSTTEISILTRKGPSYTQGDLTGTWGLNATASGPGAPWWEYGTLDFAANGSFSGVFQVYQDIPDSVSGTLVVAGDGVITCPGQTNDSHVRWTMDSGKTVAVGTMTWGTGAPGTADFSVFTRKASSYSQADVSGIWASHSLVTGGPESPAWYWGMGTIDINGNGTFNEVKDTGTQETYTRTMIIAADGSFVDVAPAGGGCTMDAGKTVIVCTVTQSTGQGSVEMPIFLKMSSFTDVVPGHWAGNYVDALSRAGITSGYGGTAAFMPDYQVTRDQMAAFIVRAKEGEPPSNYCASGSPFSDVGTSDWSCGYVKRLFEMGITTGYGGTDQYRPDLTVTRAQMAAFITRALEGEPPSNYCASGSPFSDVGTSDWSCGYVKRLFEMGITTGYGGTDQYRPDLTVIRAQMAAFIGRAFLGMN